MPVISSSLGSPVLDHPLPPPGGGGSGVPDTVCGLFLSVSPGFSVGADFSGPNYSWEGRCCPESPISQARSGSRLSPVPPPLPPDFPHAKSRPRHNSPPSGGVPEGRGGRTPRGSAASLLPSLHPLPHREDLLLRQVGDLRHHGRVEALGEHVADEEACLFFATHFAFAHH